MSVNVLEKFIDVTNECTKQLCLMLPMEKEKRTALVSDDYKRLEKMLCDQQAAAMKLELLEKQRTDLQYKAGFAGLTANEILEKAPEEERSRMTECFKDLRSAAEELKLYNQKATELAKANLCFLEGKDAVRVQAASRTTYDISGRQAGGFGNSSLTIKI